MNQSNSFPLREQTYIIQEKVMKKVLLNRVRQNEQQQPQSSASSQQTAGRKNMYYMHIS